MPFKLAHWKRLMDRLGLARRQLAEFRAAHTDGSETPRHLLDAAVISIRDVGEYCVNVLLELSGARPERHHKTNERARELRIAGHLLGNYERILEQLENYRLTAQYLGYGRAPSVHYSARNVEDCLVAIEQLVVETTETLRASGKELE